MLPPVQEVALNSIAASPRFQWSFARDLGPLIESVSRQGILTPVLLKQRESGFQIIDGLSRVQAALRCSLSEIPAAVLSADDAACFLQALETNRWTRALNAVETALILQESLILLGKEKTQQEVYGLLQIEGGRSAREFTDLLKLPESIQKGVVQESLPIRTALKFLAFGPEEGLPIWERLTSLKMNSNKINECLDWIREISVRDAKRPLEVLGRYADAADSEALRSGLRKARNPIFERRKNRFEAAVAGLKLNGRLQVQPPLFFETDAVEIKARVSTKEDLARLTELLSRDEWGQLFESLK